MVTVANLYYNQPILNRIAETFGVSFEQSSTIATLTQAGYAAGLLLICPLGDVFPRRPFILCLIAFTATIVSTSPAMACRRRTDWTTSGLLFAFRHLSTCSVVYHS